MLSTSRTLSKTLALFLFTAALSACGSGAPSGSIFGLVIVPPPAPDVAEPTNLQNMTGTQTFTAQSTMLIVRNNATKIYLGNELETNSTVIYDADTGSSRIVMTHDMQNAENVSIDETFGTADLVSTNGGIMLLSKDIGGGHTMKILYSDPDASIPGVGDIKYATNGLWYVIDDNSLDIELGYLVAGFETQVSDMPTTGSAEYDIIADAIVRGSGFFQEAIGVGTLSAAFSTGNISGNVPTVDFYDISTGSFVATDTGFSMSGSITSNSNDFTGTTSRPAVSGIPALSGVFSGSFYGPSADEVGGIFQIGTGGSDTASNLFIVGGFLGKQ